MIPHSRPDISAADIQAVTAQLSTGMIAEGEATRGFETALSERYGFRHAVATGSGCQALLLALRAAGIGRGSRVGVPTYVCPEVVGVVEALEATPVLADVGEDYALDPADPSLDGESDGVVVASLFGRYVDARRYRGLEIPVIQDWAQFIPENTAAPAHTSGEAFPAIVSFEGTKPLSAGEGGAVLTTSEMQAAKLRSMKRLVDSDLKLNLFPMSDLQAALALSQLRRADQLLRRRRHIAATYDAAFESLRGAERVARPPGSTPIRYLLKTHRGDLDDVIRNLGERGVAARRPVAVMLHHVRRSSRRFPVAEALFRSTLSIPCYPALSDSQVERVISAVRAVLE